MILAIAISWPAVIAAKLLAEGPASLGLDTLAKFGPSLAGLIMLAACLGTTSARGYLVAKFRPPANLSLWLVALLGPLAVWSVAIGIWQMLGGDALSVEPAAVFSFGPLFLQRFFLGGGLGEEIGWRGFMLPRLLERRSPLVASLILGLWWGVWHAPAFWGFGGGKSGGAVMFALFTVYTIALAVLFTAVWIRSGGNLLICTVFHASLNATENWVKAILPAVAEDAAPTLIFAGICLTTGIGIALTWVLRPNSTATADSAGATPAGN